MNMVGITIPATYQHVNIAPDSILWSSPGDFLLVWFGHVFCNFNGLTFNCVQTRIQWLTYIFFMMRINLSMIKRCRVNKTRLTPSFMTIQLHLLIQIGLSPCLIFFLPHSAPAYLVLHKCLLTYLKAFCTDLWANLYLSHYKSLTLVALLCWYSSNIFLFCQLLYRVVWTGGKEMHSGIIERFYRNEVWIKTQQLQHRFQHRQSVSFVFFHRPLR